MNKKQAFKLRHLLGSNKLLWLIAWLLGITTVLSVLGLVMVSGWFISMAAVAGVVAVGSHTFNYLMPSALIRLFAITRTAARYGDLMVSHHAVFGLLKNLRVRFFAHWAKQPFLTRTINDESSSQKMQRLVKDIDTLDEFTLRLISPWVVSVASLLAITLVLAVFMPVGVLMAVPLLLVLLVASVCLWLGTQLAKQESILIEQRKSTLLDTLPVITSLLIWQKWQNKIEHISALDTQQESLTNQVHQLRRMSNLLIQILIAVTVILVLFFAEQSFKTTTITPFSAQTVNHYVALNPAIVLAVVLGLFGLLEIVVALVAEPLALGRSLVAKTRVNQLIEYTPTQSTKIPLEKLDGELTLNLVDVCVKMPKAIVPTQPINATLSTKRPVLITGVSGAGKSTLLATLAGEILPTDGQILLNNQIYQDIDMACYLGFLGQTVDIFDQTLADNLRLGKPSATDDELLAALDKVGLLSWLNAQPKGLDTPLGEYGMAISGGQARRVALARLLLAPKAILLLDEPFAGLDSNTRQKVWNSLTTMQQQGDIGILAIATHQIWEQMHTADRLVVN